MYKTLKNLMLSAVLVGTSLAQGTFVPNTTLQVETSNNTSAADTFAGLTNSVPAPGNVSKLPVCSLLYAGATTKCYAHYMPWWGNTSHPNIGLNENDPAVVARQVKDMMSRGLTGMIIDWYGPGNFNDRTTLLVKAEAEKHPGFEFAVIEDKGAINSATDKSAKIISDLNYANKTYYVSSAYMRHAGRPVVFFFGVDAYTLDWNRIRAGVLGNPMFIFRQSGGFTHTQTNGAFSWLGISSTQDNMGLSYIDNFYATAQKYPSKEVFGSGWPGFDDTIASWGSNRIVNRQCGQTWISSLAEAGKYWSVTKPLASAQLVTWNDYEEGSEMETGIDNCVSIVPAITGTQMSWSVSGPLSTIDHFNVFLSQDGQNLMQVTTLPVGTNLVDLATVNVPPGDYTARVQAYGKPSIFNKMSLPVAVHIHPTVLEVSIEVPVGGSISSPVHIVATADGPVPILRTEVWIDYVRKYTVASATIDTSLAMTSGRHRLVIQAIDTAGASAKSIVYVTVL